MLKSKSKTKSTMGFVKKVILHLGKRKPLLAINANYDLRHGLELPEASLDRGARPLIHRLQFKFHLAMISNSEL